MRPDETDIDPSIDQCLPLLHRPQVLQFEVDVREALAEHSNHVEELDADWNLVRSRHGSNDAAYLDPRFGIHLTGGSNSIKNSFTQYRELGARARAMLLSAAAARWSVDVATLRTQAGAVVGPLAAGWVTANWPRPRWPCPCPRRSR